MKKVVKNVTGITLVALVVTIIVLLILAGIAISLTVSNNGLFTRTQKASNTWKKAEINEQQEMQSSINTYDETVKNLGLEDGESKKLIGEITGNEVSNTETTDKEGNRVVVPKGFKVINLESTVNEGIVIEDVRGNNSDTVGNQFVWIPCTIDGENESLKYDRYAFTRDNPTWDYRQTKILGANGEYEKDEDGSYKIQRASDTTYYFHEALSDTEKKSIEKYGGYYIGRYETGVDIARNASSIENITDIARIKSGLPVYNWTTRDGAETIAESMYEGKSKLCSSYAWDTALKFIDGRTGTYAIDSTGGNYEGKGGLKNTGYHSKKNIYDMGGNVWEWTTESYSDSINPYAVRRWKLQ